MQENQIKDSTQLKDLQESVNFINEKIKSMSRTDKKKRGR